MTKIVEGELILIANESGLEQTKVEGLLAKFNDPFKHARQAIELAKGIEVTREDQKVEMETARIARLELKNIRIDVEHTRKELKEQSLREGKAIDGMANIIKAMIVPVEENLEKQEKFAERLAEERKARTIAERQVKLSVYADDTSMYKYEDISEEAFNQFLSQLEAAKKVQEEAERKAREIEEEARKKAEDERIAKEKAMAEERERMRLENEKLRAEAKIREAEQEKKLSEERKKREILETEQRTKDEAIAKAKAEAEELQKRALLAPDKQKLINFADVIDKIEMPNVANREAGKLLDETKDFLTRISKNLRLKAEQL